MHRFIPLSSIFHRLLSRAILITAAFWLITGGIGCGPKWKLSPLDPAPPPVVAENGMVVAAHPLAAEAGVAVLRDGGNAVDAALAALFMLNVVEPHASGLGGGGFALVRMVDQDPKVVVYREHAPRALDIDFYYDTTKFITFQIDSTIRENVKAELLAGEYKGNEQKLNSEEGKAAFEAAVTARTSKRIQDELYLRKSQGGTSVCVPGAAAGWDQLFSNWATLPLERLAQDAIDAAENGFPIDKTLAGQIASHIKQIEIDSLMSMIFLKEIDMGEQGDTILPAIRVPYEAGDTLIQPALAKTLRIIVERGFGAFYRGPIAETIVDVVQASGGYLTLDDLTYYRTETVAPLQGEFAGYDLLTIPPPSSGGTALIEALNLFSITHPDKYDLGSPEAIHVMSQCLQQAYTDAADMIGDPKFVHTDWRQLLSLDHARRAAYGITADAVPGPRQPVGNITLSDQGNTSHLVVVDQWGNCVSLTQSINYFFGAGVVAGNTGLLLNNQMADFSLPPDSLNTIEGRKRPRSNMTPVIMLKDGQPFLVVGTPGGDRIVAAVAQIVANIISYDLDISSAIDYPRFFVPAPGKMWLENRMSLETLKKLKKIGYKIGPAPPYHVYFGGAHGIITNTSDGKLYGAADKRRGGAARGY